MFFDLFLKKFSIKKNFYTGYKRNNIAHGTDKKLRKIWKIFLGLHWSVFTAHKDTRTNDQFCSF